MRYDRKNIAKPTPLIFFLDTPSILNSTKPVLYETGYKEFPYAYAGSCFPVRWNDKLYIVSAYHCFENHEILSEKILYPIPNYKNKCFSFANTLRASNESANDLKHYDQILLEVSADIHSKKQISSVPALNLSDANSVIPLSSNNIRDVWLRGYLFDNPNYEINHELKKIRQQAHITNGFISTRKSKSDHCFYVKVITPTPDGFSANGMSGSGVYAIDNLSRIRLGGVVIEFNILTSEYLVIDASVIRELLRKANSDPMQPDH